MIRIIGKTTNPRDLEVIDDDGNIMTNITAIDLRIRPNEPIKAVVTQFVLLDVVARHNIRHKKLCAKASLIRDTFPFLFRRNLP